MRQTKKELIEQAVKELKRLQTCDDTEVAHADADDVLTELLKNLGCAEVVEEYEKIDKWYS